MGRKFYRPSTVQPLNESHVEQRKKFCTWILEQPAGFVQNVIWTDEKFFVLNQKPNRKNDGTWNKENPHKIVETNDRNGKKVMMFVAVVDGQIPIVHAFLDEDDKNQSVNGACYLDLLQDVVWPALRSKATRKGAFTVGCKMVRLRIAPLWPRTSFSRSSTVGLSVGERRSIGQRIPRI